MCAFFFRPRRTKRHSLRCMLLPVALFAAWPTVVSAAAEAPSLDGDAASARPVELEAVTVSALPLDGDAARQSTPFSVVEGEALLRRGAATLGDSLDGLPGVHADSFGAGASRPVIRGQTAPRVSVLSDGSALFDASAISPDHAITADPLLLRRVEVLRGPVTLLYGGGAIGGVVNVLDGRIPAALPAERVQGFAALRGNTVADEKAGAVSVDVRLPGNLVLHAEHAARDADDYEIAGFTERVVAGSWSESRTSSAGLSWIGERGYIGMAYTTQDDRYGLPGHSHEHENCSLAGTVLDCAGDGHDRDHDEVPYVDLRSRRLDVRGEYDAPLAGIEQLRLRFNRTRYVHDEIEDDAIGTTFLNYGHETRLEATHAPYAGWHGVFGIQYGASEFNARGTESFIPKTEQDTLAFFVFERRALSMDWTLELGARHEKQVLTPLGDALERPESRERATSLSSALVWQFAEDYRLSLALARAQRLPQAQELYANGVHLATNTYECGLLSCPSLGPAADVQPETSHNLGLNLRRLAGDFSFDVGVYHNRIDDYVWARTLDRVDDFRLIRYEQSDAEFTGAEGRADYHFAEGWTAGVSADVVRATLRASGEPLPRIPPARVGLRIGRQWPTVSAEIDLLRVLAQDRITADETRTPGHALLNAGVNWRLRGDAISVFLQGRNLLGETVWNHSSFLANRIPEPGRNVSAGLRIAF